MRATRAVRNVTAAEKSVLHVIADHADPAGRCFMALASIAAEACVSESTARRGLRRLEAAGLVGSELVKGMGYRFKVAVAEEQSHFVTPVNLTDTPVNLTVTPVMVTALPPGGTPVNLTDYTDTTTTAPVTVTGTPVNLTGTPVTVTPKGIKGSVGSGLSSEDPPDTVTSPRDWFDVEAAMNRDPLWVRFATAYPKKIKMAEAFRTVWPRMPEADRRKAADAAEQYAVAIRPSEIQYAPLPENWLLKRGYLDTYEPPRSPDEVDFMPSKELLAAQEANFQAILRKYEAQQARNGVKNDR